MLRSLESLKQEAAAVQEALAAAGTVLARVATTLAAFAPVARGAARPAAAEPAAVTASSAAPALGSRAILAPIQRREASTCLRKGSALEASDSGSQREPERGGGGGRG